MSHIVAVVLAAGESRRMGSPKMALPWGDTTVIGEVIQVLDSSGVPEIVVVTGGARQAVEAAIDGLPARAVFNPQYAAGEMLSTLQVGLQSLSPQAGAALVVLGDQPQIQAETVRQIISAYQQGGEQLIVPSFQQRRGHPWLVARSLWPAILPMQPPATFRDFLNDHSSKIRYLLVENDSVLHDIDTPGDYQREKPG